MIRPRFLQAWPAEIAELKRAMVVIGRRRPSAGRLTYSRSRDGARGVLFPPITVGEAGIVLAALTAVNCRQVSEETARPLTRRVLESRRVRYIRTDDEEWWLFLRQVWRNRGGDCEDLAAGVAGSLRAAGIWARAIILPAKRGISHVVVELADGSTVDPSVWGGMNTLEEMQEASRHTVGDLARLLGMR